MFDVLQVMRFIVITMARFVCLFPFHHLRVENDLAVVCLANNTDIILVTYFSRAQLVGIFILHDFVII